MKMKNIKLIACDIDGVLLEDTFSPVLHILAQRFNIPYTAELENNMFSQNRGKAVNYFLKQLSLSGHKESEDVLKLFFDERQKYIDKSGTPILDGVPEFISLLKNLDVKIVCYGGLDYEMIDKRFTSYLKNFDQYICTNDFRPGLKEIVKNFYQLEYQEVLFIDDVAEVAKEAKKYSIPFIGIPTQHSWGFQKDEMAKVGTKYIVSSVKEITKEYLERLDSDQAIWEGQDD